MTSRVFLTPRAERDLNRIVRRTAKSAPVTTARWLSRFRTALANLALNPEGYPLAPEDDDDDFQIRQLLFGKARSIYRALFRINDNEVRVLHIRWTFPRNSHGSPG